MVHLKKAPSGHLLKKPSGHLAKTVNNVTFAVVRWSGFATFDPPFDPIFNLWLEGEKTVSLVGHILSSGNYVGLGGGGERVEIRSELSPRLYRVRLYNRYYSNTDTDAAFTRATTDDFFSGFGPGVFGAYTKVYSDPILDFDSTDSVVVSAT